ncbi:early nodulin-like protein 1 [Quercus lobata]|uniref:early nodulin-like protein 1 n=1 Tax=Quercus lobata TaxID=97700 RepID=UPI001245D744|nr:early nodulin-like protein 1 [Quercus lobata]
MASMRTTIIPFITLLPLLFMSSVASGEISIGGNKTSWGAPSPSLSFNEWTKSIRFKVGDLLGNYPSQFPITLFHIYNSPYVFRYDPNVDSVLHATKEDYETCNNVNPIKKYDGGLTKIELDTARTFYFHRCF